ncbi:MAG: hypothetical protein U9O94_01055 [Nanoarchaeota archaeon]|nr:hypothetical protein [Nanoarchaeota archaeon]
MKNASSKAQVAMEYLIVMGIVFMATVPFVYYAMRESNVNIQMNQADDVVKTLSRAADTVYSIGPGTTKYVSVSVPSGIQTYSLDNQSVSIQVYVFGGLSDIFADTKAELVGDIPITEGLHRVMVKMLDSGYVQFGEADDAVAPVVLWVSPEGTINYNGIILRVTTSEYSTCRYDVNDVSYPSMSEPFIGNALTHERDLGILDNGTYVYYARCQDPSANVMQESAAINFTIVPVFIQNDSNESEPPETGDPYEPDVPVISLVNPWNGYVDDDGVVLFQYNVTDMSSIWYCQLIINGTVDQSDFDVTRNITQNFTKMGLNYGDYIWSINCSDVHLNKNSSELRDINVNYSQDSDVPVVDLVSPDNNTVRNYWLTGFSYNTTDVSSGINYCDLHMEGALDGGGEINWDIRDSPIVEDQLETIMIPLFKGNYTWSVGCVDDSYTANEGYSGTFNLRVNVTAGEEAFLDSCAGHCGYIGYVDGICRQNEAKCNDYVGGTWESDGDQYCPTQVGDFCCCAQELIV